MLSIQDHEIIATMLNRARHEAFQEMQDKPKTRRANYNVIKKIDSIRSLLDDIFCEAFPEKPDNARWVISPYYG